MERRLALLPGRRLHSAVLRQGKTPLGPVHVDFAFGKGKEERLAQKINWESKSKSPKGTYLYVRALPVDRVGTYHATVTNRDGKVLAAAVVEGTRDFFHPWMPWLHGFEHFVAPWEDGIALPRLDSLAPAIFLEPGKAYKGKLPTFLPDDEKPALTIKKVGKELVIRADTNFTTSRPERHFLARWWVNGKPFVPKQTDKFSIFAGYGLVKEDEELRVEFDFRPERLGARPGDKISLQLMHSESCWDWCADEFLAADTGQANAARTSVFPIGSSLKCRSRAYVVSAVRGRRFRPVVSPRTRFMASLRRFACPGSLWRPIPCGACGQRAVRFAPRVDRGRPNGSWQMA
jgi:hypothetical protein